MHALYVLTSKRKLDFVVFVVIIIIIIIIII
jgi:hypothetical protein